MAFVELPTEPGWGIELDKETMANKAITAELICKATTLTITRYERNF
jgi:hypothetical protein